MIVDYLYCSICGKQISGTLHTSQPIRKGLCCDSCFKEHVKPRMDFLFSELNRVNVDESR